MSNRSTNNTNPHYQRNILIWIIAVLIAIYGGIGLGSLDIWEDAAVLRKFCLGFGAVVSMSLGGYMPFRTLKGKGYGNLLWLVLPIPVMTVIDLTVRFLLGISDF